MACKLLCILHRRQWLLQQINALRGLLCLVALTWWVCLGEHNSTGLITLCFLLAGPIKCPEGVPILGRPGACPEGHHHSRSVSAMQSLPGALCTNLTLRLKAGPHVFADLHFVFEHRMVSFRQCTVRIHMQPVQPTWLHMSSRHDGWNLYSALSVAHAAVTKLKCGKWSTIGMVVVNAL